MHRNRERRGKQGRGRRRQGGKEIAAASDPVLLSEVFLLEDGGIAEGMKGAGLGSVSR